jgi:hypothetical protein
MSHSAAETSKWVSKEPYYTVAVFGFEIKCFVFGFPIDVFGFEVECPVFGFQIDVFGFEVECPMFQWLCLVLQ